MLYSLQYILATGDQCDFGQWGFSSSPYEHFATTYAITRLQAKTNIRNSKLCRGHIKLHTQRIQFTLITGDQCEFGQWGFNSSPCEYFATTYAITRLQAKINVRDSKLDLQRAYQTRNPANPVNLITGDQCEFGQWGFSSSPCEHFATS